MDPLSANILVTMHLGKDSRPPKAGSHAVGRATSTNVRAAVNSYERLKHCFEDAHVRAVIAQIGRTQQKSTASWYPFGGPNRLPPT